MKEKLNEYEKHLQMCYDLGAKPIPEGVWRMGSYATDYPGERPDPDHPGQFLHGAVPPGDEPEQSDEGK